MSETRSSEIAHAHALRRICTPSLLPNLAQLNHSLIVLAHPAVKAKAFLCFEDGVAEIFAVGGLPAAVFREQEAAADILRYWSGTHWQWDLTNVSFMDRNHNKGGSCR